MKDNQVVRMVEEGALVLSERSRLELFRVLSLPENDWKTTGILADKAGIRPSVASHHLQIMETSGWVKRVTSGPHARWSLNRERLEEFELALRLMMKGVSEWQS